MHLKTCLVSSCVFPLYGGAALPTKSVRIAGEVRTVSDGAESPAGDDAVMSPPEKAGRATNGGRTLDAHGHQHLPAGDEFEDRLGTPGKTIQ